MHQWFVALVAPALIASIMTLLINIRLDKVRVRRDYIGTSYEAVRNGINEAVSAAAAYYPLPSAERTASLEAKIWMADRELRFSIPALMDNATTEARPDFDALSETFDDFIAELTGGTFQQTGANSDLKHFRKIASVGAELRAKITQARHEELRRAVDKDPLSRMISYLNEPMGIK